MIRYQNEKYESSFYSKMVELHFFTTTDFKGKVTESNEIRSIWCNIDQIPLSNMWPNDAYYMNIIIANQKFIGHFILNNPEDKKSYPIT